MTEKKTFWDYTLEVLAENKASWDEFLYVDAFNAYTPAEFKAVAETLTPKDGKGRWGLRELLTVCGTDWNMELIPCGGGRQKWRFAPCRWRDDPCPPMSEAILPQVKPGPRPSNFWSYTIRVIYENGADERELCGAEVDGNVYSLSDFEYAARFLHMEDDDKPPKGLADTLVLLGYAADSPWRMSWTGEKWDFSRCQTTAGPPRLPLKEAIRLRRKK